MPGTFWVTAHTEYDLIVETGRGAYSTIWKAREKRRGKVLAVKVFNKFNNTMEELERRLEVKNEDQILHLVRGGVSETIRT
jgi:hypothetical protein